MKNEALEIHFRVIIDTRGTIKGKIGNPHFLFGQKAPVMDKGLVHDFRKYLVADHGEISMGNVASCDELENQTIKEIAHFEAKTLLSAPPIHQHDVTGPSAFDEGQNRRGIIFPIRVHDNITLGICLQAMCIVQSVTNGLLVAGVMAKLDDF